MRNYTHMSADEVVVESISTKLKWLARRLRWIDEWAEIERWISMMIKLETLKWNIEQHSRGERDLMGKRKENAKKRPRDTEAVEERVWINSSQRESRTPDSLHRKPREEGKQIKEPEWVNVQKKKKKDINHMKPPRVQVVHDLIEKTKMSPKVKLENGTMDWVQKPTRVDKHEARETTRVVFGVQID